MMMLRLSKIYAKKRKKIQNLQKQNQNQRKKRKTAEFALLSLKELKVVFDLPTPRPHFIIVPRDCVELEGSDYNELADSTKRELVEAATTMISEYKLKGELILSIHRGSWISDKKNFHAHLCVDVNQYLQIYETKKWEITRWPDHQGPEGYEDKVRAYRKSYFKKEVKDTRLLTHKKKEAPTSGTTFNNYTLLYHPSEPKVGFVVSEKSSDSSAKSSVHALDAMDEFAGENDLADPESSNDGCHICLVLSEQNHGFEMSEKLLGYIHTSAPKFYSSFCPSNKRKNWFEKFSKLPDCHVPT